MREPARSLGSSRSTVHRCLPRKHFPEGVPKTLIQAGGLSPWFHWLRRSPLAAGTNRCLMGQSAPSIDGEKPTGFWALRGGDEALEFVEPIQDDPDHLFLGRVYRHIETGPVRGRVPSTPSPLGIRNTRLKQ